MLYPTGSPAFQIVPELEPREGEVVVDYVSLEGTFLNLAMRASILILSLVFALEIRIEPTVRQSLDVNYIPVIVTDACGSKTEELKQRLVASMHETGGVFMTSMSRSCSKSSPESTNKRLSSSTINREMHVLSVPIPSALFSIIYRYQDDQQ
jgi:nicotinamidase-related amidase